MEERCRIPTMKESDGCIVDMYLLGGETCGWYLDIHSFFFIRNLLRK